MKVTPVIGIEGLYNFNGLGETGSAPPSSGVSTDRKANGQFLATTFGVRF